MSLRTLAALLALIGIAACGGSTPAQPANGPTAANVAVQAGDLPSGVVKCDLSGDIDKYITAEESTDPKTAKATKADWDEAQKNGANAAYVSLFSDSTAQCAVLKKASTDITATTHPLVVNFVIQFKDEKSAAKGYSSPKKIFGFSAADLRESKLISGQPVVEGTKTGLSENSIVLSTTVSNQSFYIAVWQNKTFIVFLAILNMDSAASKKAATAENSRIK
jgi:hypothetical protein